MKIIYKHPKELTPYGNNSKKHPEKQILALMRAITELGFDQPIVVDQNMVIIKGHGRREAAMRLNLDSVPVVVRDISSTDAKFLRVADNAVPSDQWDMVALSEELNELNVSGFDLAVTGFELKEISKPKQPHAEGVSLVLELPKTTHQCDECGYRW